MLGEKIMVQLISNNDAERCLRDCLEKQGYKLSIPRINGEIGVDILANKGEE